MCHIEITGGDSWKLSGSFSAYVLVPVACFTPPVLNKQNTTDINVFSANI